MDEKRNAVLAVEVALLGPLKLFVMSRVSRYQG